MTPTKANINNASNPRNRGHIRLVDEDDDEETGRSGGCVDGLIVTDDEVVVVITGWGEVGIGNKTGVVVKVCSLLLNVGNGPQRVTDGGQRRATVGIDEMGMNKIVECVLIWK